MQMELEWSPASAWRRHEQRRETRGKRRRTVNYALDQGIHHREARALRRADQGLQADAAPRPHPAGVERQGRRQGVEGFGGREPHLLPLRGLRQDGAGLSRPRHGLPRRLPAGVPGAGRGIRQARLPGAAADAVLQAGRRLPRRPLRVERPRPRPPGAGLPDLPQRHRRGRRHLLHLPGPPRPARRRASPTPTRARSRPARRSTSSPAGSASWGSEAGSGRGPRTRRAAARRGRPPLPRAAPPRSGRGDGAIRT